MNRRIVPATRPLTGRILARGLMLTVAACGDEEDRGPYLASRSDEVAFEADWKPTTRLIEDPVGRLVDADLAAGTYTFAGDDATAVGDLAALVPGDVAVLEGVGLVRIDSVVASGNQVVVQGGPAALADAIQDGTLAWDVGFDFARPERFLWVEVGLGLPGTGAEAYATVKNEVIANTTVHYEAAGPYPVVTGTCLEVGVNLGVYLGGALKAFGITLKGDEFPVSTRVMPVKKSGECK